MGNSSSGRNTEAFTDVKSQWLRFTQWPRPSIDDAFTHGIAATMADEVALRKRLVNIVRSAYTNATPMIVTQSHSAVTQWDILSGTIVHLLHRRSNDWRLIRRGRLPYIRRKGGLQTCEYLRQLDVIEPHDIEPLPYFAQLCQVMLASQQDKVKIFAATIAAKRAVKDDNDIHDIYSMTHGGLYVMIPATHGAPVLWSSRSCLEPAPLPLDATTTSPPTKMKKARMTKVVAKPKRRDHAGTIHTLPYSSVSSTIKWMGNGWIATCDTGTLLSQISVGFAFLIFLLRSWHQVDASS
jgi:hypothetical protein